MPKLASFHNLHGLNVLLTLGPTREYLDPVRFLTNGSSGKMGLAIAEAMEKFGAKLFLICGPDVIVPERFARFEVRSAREMNAAVQDRFSAVDLFISCAAVSDYRPKKISKIKLHKRRNLWTLSMIQNPDILAIAGSRKKNQFVVGFALEDALNLTRARQKMHKKNCDLIVLNDRKTIDSRHINAIFLTPDGGLEKTGLITKKRCAELLCQKISLEIARKIAS